MAIAGEGIPELGEVWPLAAPRTRFSVTAAVIALGLHAALAVAVTAIDPARFHAETPIEIDVEEHVPPPPEAKPAAPEPPPPPRAEPRPRVAMRRAPAPSPTPPPESRPPSEAPPKADEPPPTFGVNLDSTVGPGPGMAVPVGNTLMTKPGKPSKAVAVAPSGEAAAPFVPAADIYIAKYAEPISIVNGDDIYPEDARRMGIEGVVKVKLGIDEKGNVVQVKVIEGAGHGFDEAAAKAMRKAKFKPAFGNDGHPLPSNIIYTYRFELNR